MSQDVKDRIFFNGNGPYVDMAVQPQERTPVIAPRVADEEKRIRRMIEDAAARNASLLNDIMSTEEAVHAFETNLDRLTLLKRELEAQRSVVLDSSTAASEQLSKFNRERASTLKKWYYTLTRMRRALQERIKEDERLYREKLMIQSRAEKRLNELENDHQAIEQDNAGLFEDTKRHGAAHEEIDKLYEAIFDGPTPGFSDEDERESKYKTDKDEHDAKTEDLKRISKASKDITLLRSTIIRARRENKNAEDQIESSLFFGTDGALIYLERCARLIEKAITTSLNAIDGLQNLLDDEFTGAHQNVTRHLVEAQRKATSTINMPSPNSRDVLDASREIADTFEAALHSQADLARLIKSYDKAAKDAVKFSSRTVETSRQALHEIRQGAFEIVVGFGAAAPPYHECCDRTERYENDALQECEQIPDPIIDDRGLPPPPSYEAVTGE